MSLVAIRNRLPQLVTISLLDVATRQVVEEVKLQPRAQVDNVDSGRVTDYTKGLANRGVVEIVPVTP